MPSSERVPTALVDRCVLPWFVPIEPAKLVIREIQWYTTTVRAESPGFRRKKMDAWQWSQVRTLPTIARLAREGALTLHTYSELAFEGMLAGEKLKATRGNLLWDVTLHWVDMAVDRGYFRQSADFGKYVEGESLASFLDDFLLVVDENQLLAVPHVRDRLPPFVQENLRNLGRFRALCKGLTRDQRRDAMHLWTAEVHGLDYFLTMDRRFLNAMKNSKKGPFPSAPVLPDELIAALGITELDPFPVPEGDYVPYIELFRER